MDILETKGLTPTESRLWGLLRDGLPHNSDELLSCLEDELSELQNVHWHLTSLRKKITHFDIEIVCQYVNRRRHWRIMRPIKDTFLLQTVNTLD